MRQVENERRRKALAASDAAIAAHKAELEKSRRRLDSLIESPQAAADALTADIEKAREQLGDQDPE